jgi:hypothetical protein
MKGVVVEGGVVDIFYAQVEYFASAHNTIVALH